jgi:DNA invertase Pin-like site-specific DNA recombinase
MRAAIYARYSSDLQRDASIEDQIRLCRERIAREGWQLVTTYTDRAQSGASQLRPGYQQLLEDARRGQFDVVVAEALDRLSRDQEHVAALFKQLTFAGVRIVTLAEGAVSELHVGLKGTMNALFLKDLATKTRRGLRGRVEAGRSAGGGAFGYIVAVEHDARGERVRGGRMINESEAVVVRRIFAAFAAGQTPRAIARALNAEGVPGPGGRPWSDTTIRGHAARRTGILRNDLYAGRLVWNKQAYVKHPKTGRRLARPNPEQDWVVQECPELRMVDQYLWAQVQERLAAIRTAPGVQKARERRFWLNRRPKHLLTHLARCGCCGGTLAAVGKDYLACGRARRQGLCDNRRGIPRAVLERLILGALRERLMAPELVKEFIAEFHHAVNHNRQAQELRIAAKRKALADARTKLDGLVEAIAGGLRGTSLQVKLDELEQRKAALEAEVAAAPAPLPRLHPNLAEVYRRKVEALHEALADPHTGAEALEILRSLIERVVVHPSDTGFEIELVGEIAHMVALGSTTNTKRAAISKDAACSVKVVAGARYPLFRNRRRWVRGAPRFDRS